MLFQKLRAYKDGYKPVFNQRKHSTHEANSCFLLRSWIASSNLLSWIKQTILHWKAKLSWGDNPITEIRVIQINNSDCRIDDGHMVPTLISDFECSFIFSILIKFTQLCIKLWNQFFLLINFTHADTKMILILRKHPHIHNFSERQSWSWTTKIYFTFSVHAFEKIIIFTFLCLISFMWSYPRFSSKGFWHRVWYWCSLKSMGCVARPASNVFIVNSEHTIFEIE